MSAAGAAGLADQRKQCKHWTTIFKTTDKNIAYPELYSEKSKANGCQRQAAVDWGEDPLLPDTVVFFWISKQDEETSQKKPVLEQIQQDMAPAETYTV